MTGEDRDQRNEKKNLALGEWTSRESSERRS